MLKQYTAWLLVFAVLTANCSRLFVYVGFKINQNYIATRLCENRNKPWMHCDGKCYFMKKIRQAEENERNKASKELISHIETVFFAEPVAYNVTRNAVAVKESVLPRVSGNHYSGCFYCRIFQPPRVS